MREAIKQANALPPSVELYALAFMLLVTEGKTLVWTYRHITEVEVLGEETIH